MENCPSSMELPSLVIKRFSVMDSSGNDHPHSTDMNSGKSSFAVDAHDGIRDTLVSESVPARGAQAFHGNRKLHKGLKDLLDDMLIDNSSNPSIPGDESHDSAVRSDTTTSMDVTRDSPLRDIQSAPQRQHGCFVDSNTDSRAPQDEGIISKDGPTEALPPSSSDNPSSPPMPFRDAAGLFTGSNPSAHMKRLDMSQPIPPYEKLGRSTAAGTMPASLPLTQADPNATLVCSETECTLVPRWTKHMIRKGNRYVMRPDKDDPRFDPKRNIYARGVKGLQVAQAKIEAQRAALLEAEQRNNTFKPAITKRAKLLSRSPGMAQHAEAARMRKLILMLEMPSSEGNLSSPRISKSSERIVRRCRAGSISLPAGERLYRDAFCRRSASMDVSATHQSSVVRSKKAIDEHIATLHLYERKRVETLESLREKVAETSAQSTLYVNPTEVVERLTAVKQELAVVPDENLIFVPKLNSLTEAHVENARLRGWVRWFQFFADRGTLDVDHLASNNGPFASTAQSIASALQADECGRRCFSCEEFCSVMLDSEQRGGISLWRTRPHRDSPRCAELTFAPRINTRSYELVEEVEKGKHIVAHERLFMQARTKQLDERQRELEEQQRQLIEEQRTCRKRAVRMRHSKLPNAPPGPPCAPASPGTPAMDDGPAPPTKCRPSVETPPAARVAAGDRSDSRPAVAASPISESPVRDEKKGTPPNRNRGRPTTCRPVSTLAQTRASKVLEELQCVLDAPATRVIPLPIGSSSAIQHDRTDSAEQVRHVNATTAAADIAIASGAYEKAEPPVLIAPSLLLECATCRSPAVVRADVRRQVEKENRRRLRNLGMQLYRQSVHP